MVKKLRIKFMIVTMSMMLTVFSVFFVINYFYNDYWDVVDTVGTLEWLADSGVFTDETLAKDNELFQDAYSGEDNPIIGVIADGHGSVLSQQNIGKDKNRVVRQERSTAFCHKAKTGNTINRIFIPSNRWTTAKN